MEDLPLPDSQPAGSHRRKYGEVAYRLGVIIDTVSWATGLKPSYVTLALILAFILAFGSAVTGTVLLLASGRPAPLKPGDGAYGPVNGDEAAAEAEKAAAAAEAEKTKRKDSTQFAGAGASGGRGAMTSGGYAGASWAGLGSGSPIGAGGGSGTGGGRVIPVYGGAEDAEVSAGREESAGTPKAKRTAKAGSGGPDGDGQRPRLKRLEVSAFHSDGGAQTQANVGAGGGQGAGAGGAMDGGAAGGGEGPAGAAGGGGAGKGALGQGLTPLPKVPEIGAGKAVRDANTKNGMPTSSHNVPKGPGEDDDKDKDKKKKGPSTGEFKTSEAAPGSPDGKDGKGKAWDIYLDKSRAHDLSDGQGVHNPPQEAQTIGPK